jgi:hypothetical protein
MTSRKNIPIYIVLGIVLSISIGQAVYFVQKLDDSGVISDMKLYYENAQNLTAAGHHFPLGYPVFLSVLFAIFSPSPLNAYYGNIFLFALSILCLFFIARNLSGWIAGLLAATLYAFSFEAVFLSGLILTETLQNFLFLAILSVICSRHIIKKSIQGNVFIALILVLTTLTKIPLLFLAFPFALIVPFKKQNGFLRILKSYWISIFLCIVLLFSFGIFNQINHGKFVVSSSNGPLNLFIGNNPKADGRRSSAIVDLPSAPSEKEQEKQYIEYALEFRDKFPEKVQALTVQRILYWWVTDPQQDEQYELIKAGERTKELFLISTNFLFFLGIPAVFFCIICTTSSIIHQLKTTQAQHISLMCCRYSSILALLLLISTLLTTGKNSTFIILYQLHIGTGLLSIICAILLYRSEDSRTIERLLIPVGIAFYTSLYVLFFFVKIRYRFPLIPFYCLFIGIVSNDIIVMIREKIFNRKFLARLYPFNLRRMGTGGNPE